MAKEGNSWIGAFHEIKRQDKKKGKLWSLKLIITVKKLSYCACLTLASATAHAPLVYKTSKMNDQRIPQASDEEKRNWCGVMWSFSDVPHLPEYCSCFYTTVSKSFFNLHLDENKHERDCGCPAFPPRTVRCPADEAARITDKAWPYVFSINWVKTSLTANEIRVPMMLWNLEFCAFHRTIFFMKQLYSYPRTMLFHTWYIIAIS